MLLAVAAGGAVGAVGRYLVISAVGHIFGTGFPLGTIVVNVVGSFVLGALIEALALVWSPSPELRAMVVVGVLGAFTTFSTFSMDVVLLYERGALGQAALYIGASVILSIGAFFLGLSLLRSALA
ncbi:MAG: fluoride efflux transporter CrcB [Kiloniellales bacterium]|nr:fluoride efflux transporter CrcB [Kiloniellales bacterium]MDJ0983519.1 fluoride efflux transporter CrcB [Kiloniellales bacterium]